MCFLHSKTYFKWFNTVLIDNTGWGNWPFNSCSFFYPSLSPPLCSFRPDSVYSVQAFTRCFGACLHMCPGIASMSRHVIIRTSYHFWVPGPLLVSLLLSLASFSLCHSTLVLTLAFRPSLLHMCLRWAASVRRVCSCTPCLNSPLQAMVPCSLCRAVFGCFWLASWQIRRERLEDVLRKKEGKVVCFSAHGVRFSCVIFLPC